jgi:hypothetical protein
MFKSDDLSQVLGSGAQQAYRLSPAQLSPTLLDSESEIFRIELGDQSLRLPSNLSLNYKQQINQEQL